jgi:hypothetical protein
LRGTGFVHTRCALFVIGEIGVLGKLQHYRAGNAILQRFGQLLQEINGVIEQFGHKLLASNI